MPKTHKTPYQLLLKKVSLWIKYYEGKSEHSNDDSISLKDSAYELLLEIRDTIIEREGK